MGYRSKFLLRVVIFMVSGFVSLALFVMPWFVGMIDILTGN